MEELKEVEKRLRNLEKEIQNYKLKIVKGELWGTPFFYRMSKINRELKRLSK